MGAVVTWLERLMLGLAVVCVCLIMLIVTYDAISRYILHAPLPWAFELITYYLLIAAVYFAVSATFQHGDHINIDLFRVMMRPAVRARLDFAWGLLTAVIFAVITYGAWKEMTHAFSRNEFLPGYITWPAWVSYLPIFLGSLLMVARLLVHAFKLLIHGEDREVVEFGEHNE